MALPMLIGGAPNCGPVNPLQGLTKTFDQDRGVQQDQFGAGRAGPSRETFRTQQLPSRQLDQDAASFFSADRPIGPSVFDMTNLNASLPAALHETPSISQPLHQRQEFHTVSWAADFLQHQHQHAGTKKTGTSVPVLRPAPGLSIQFPTRGNENLWAPPAYRPLHNLAAPLPSHIMTDAGVSNTSLKPDPSLWDQDFIRRTPPSIGEQTQIAQDLAREQISHGPADGDADALSRTAGLLVETLRDEPNPKFRNSEFMGFMRSLRDKTLVVEGKEIIHREGPVSGIVGLTDDIANSMAVKGKGRAVADIPVASASQLSQPVGMPMSMLNSGQVHDGGFYVEPIQHAVADQPLHEDTTASPSSADEVYEYFRQDNEDYIQYQNERNNHSPPVVGGWNDNTAEWDKLQSDWDSFEATSIGIRPIANYQFTPNNPYLLGERSGTTSNHSHHSYETYESVLELEAAVQREPTDARAWFALGVKQQDNERESKAIEALRRSVELDPEYLPSWLALGISHTNESNRSGAYDAIREWVVRHKFYKSLPIKLNADAMAHATQLERYQELINCLIAMARSEVGGDLDADIQVALAVLLNSNEEYAKATDCFRTALAVRPNDWVLYNRVGATLANNGAAEEALEYYYRALELNPMYIRARFNLGISCTNLHRFEEAGRHILDALTLQDSDTVGDARGGVTSAALWNCLRTVCVHMNKMDLAGMCLSQDLEGLRQQFHS